jgi:phosphotransferase system HPr (HPr) family protein
MISGEAVLRDRYGLHPRAANRIQQTAAGFASKLTLAAADGGSDLDPRSLLALVSSSIRQGDRVRVTADGPDEADALAALVALLEGGVCHP